MQEHVASTILHQNPLDVILMQANVVCDLMCHKVKGHVWTYSYLSARSLRLEQVFDGLVSEGGCRLDGGDGGRVLGGGDGP